MLITPETSTSEHSDLEKQQVEGLNPKNILVVCNAGKNRSKLIADILNEHGYSAKNIGAGGATPFEEQDIPEESDLLVFVTPTVKEMFYKRLQEIGMAGKFQAIPCVTLNFAENSAMHASHEDARYISLVEKETKELEEHGLTTQNNLSQEN